MLRILVPLDGSSAAEDALKHAISITKTFSAELILLRVIAEADSAAAVRIDSVDFALWRHQATNYLNSLIEHYATTKVSIRAQVAEGNAAETVVQFMRTEKPGLVVLTRYGSGNAMDFAAGGTAQKIVASAECSVLLLDPHKRMDPEVEYKRILVPVDGSKGSDCAVAIATMLADTHNASLVLLHVSEDPCLTKSIPATQHAQTLTNEMHRLIRHEAERRLGELATNISKKLVVERRVLVSSDPPFAIESVAEEDDSDLLLLHATTAGSTGNLRLGSINQSLIQYSHRALFILQPSAGEGFLSQFRSIYLDESHVEAG